MANLVSPGVSVTITDESFFIPAAAPTVPLLLIATADEKVQPDGILEAAGTYEYDVVRTVTSVTQSLELFGVPRFIEDTNSNQHHGDARNEYGLFALNQFLGLGNLAYTLRANINLNDDLSDLRTSWDRKLQEAGYVLENLINIYIAGVNDTNSFFPSTPATAGYQDVTFGTTTILSGDTPTSALTQNYDFTISVDGNTPVAVTVALTATQTMAQHLVVINAALVAVGATVAINDGNLRFTSDTLGSTPASTIVVGESVISNDALFTLGFAIFGTVGYGTATAGQEYKQTVTETELTSLVEEAMLPVYDAYSFSDTHDTFMLEQLPPLLVFPDGYDLPPGPTSFAGVVGDIKAFVASLDGATPTLEDQFTGQEASNLLFGAADNYKFTTEFSDKTSLGATDAIRRVDIVTALQAAINSNQEIRSENFEYNLILCPGYPELADEMLLLVADLGDEAFVIADTPMEMDATEVVAWSSTTARQSSTHVAYYYPHSLASNIDGVNVLASASGTALRTYAYSDGVSELWFPPAGTRRGLVTGVTDVGYAKGTLGQPTKFQETHLNQGQRDNLYKYFTNLNPIVFFPGRGIIMWGQKTSSPDASALDRVNVSRLVKYIKRQLRKNTMSYVFEPNDQLTRDNLKATVDGFLGDLIVKRGLYDFASVCDESNNTPDRIDRNELYIDIAIKPVKAAEFIYIPIRVVATGAEI